VSNGTATCLPDGAHTLVTGELDIDGTDNLLDLTDNSLVVDYDPTPNPYGDVVAAVKAAWNSGAWDGAGITCDGDAGTWALGVADNADPDFPTRTDLGGKTVDATSVLVRYTFYGNTNLDDRVDAADLSKLLGEFGTIAPTPDEVMPWFAGNFNYDDRVDAADLSKLLGNWGNVEPGAGGGALEPLMSEAPPEPLEAPAEALFVSMALVPEPATLLLAASGALAVLARRRGADRRRPA
jgi:hypothetical protein